MMSHVSRTLSLLCILILLEAVESKGPPVIIGGYKGRRLFYTRVGSTVELVCSIQADPPPVLLQWSKGHEQIHSGWGRFKMNRNLLKINDVSKEDRGNYTCKATNGFGSRSINMTLVVIDKYEPSNNDTFVHHAQFSIGGKKITHKDGSPPVFVQPSKMQKKAYQRPVGSTVHLKCRAHAKPRPRIVWYKNGREMVRFSNTQRPHWTLKLDTLKKDDGGRYLCKVGNVYGHINYTYTLVVIDKVKHKPILIPPHPVNTTVQFGTTATFQCKVKSAVQPHIQWLKRVDDVRELRNRNATIDVKGQKFIVLKSGQVWPRSDGSYTNKLIIPRAGLEDEGMYICLGANTMGYSFKSAHLKVIPPRNKDLFKRLKTKLDKKLKIPTFEVKEDESEQLPRSSVTEGASSSLPYIIAIPSTLVIVVVAIAIFILQKKKKCNNPTETCVALKEKTLQGVIDRQKFAPLPPGPHSRSTPQPLPTQPQMHVVENRLMMHRDHDDSLSTRPSVNAGLHRGHTSEVGSSVRTGQRSEACSYGGQRSEVSAYGGRRSEADTYGQWDVLAGYSDISSVSQTNRHQHGHAAINHYNC